MFLNLLVFFSVRLDSFPSWFRKSVSLGLKPAVALLINESKVTCFTQT